MIEPEQQVDMPIQGCKLLRTKAAPVRQGLATVIVFPKQDDVRHGFSSSLFQVLLIRGEGEGIAIHGSGRRTNGNSPRRPDDRAIGTTLTIRGIPVGIH